MKKRFLGLNLLLLILFSVVGQFAGAAKDFTPQEVLEKEQVRMDTAAANTGASIAKVLTDRFNMTPIAIQELRDTGLSWGELTILMVMADQLKEQVKEYPSYGEALKKVSGLRAERLSYDDIAKRMNFLLPPVITESQRLRRLLKKEKR